MSIQENNLYCKDFAERFLYRRINENEETVMLKNIYVNSNSSCTNIINYHL